MRVETTVLSVLAISAGMAMLAACSSQADLADTIYQGGDILTMNGRIVFVGSISDAMARESRTGEVIGPDQRVDAYTALQGLTTGPAWQIFEEDRKGMIKTGLLADFVILSSDPVKTEVSGIREIEVLETIKEGRTIYKKDQ